MNLNIIISSYKIHKFQSLKLPFTRNIKHTYTHITAQSKNSSFNHKPFMLLSITNYVWKMVACVHGKNERKKKKKTFIKSSHILKSLWKIFHNSTE